MRRIGKSNNERHWLGKREMRSHWRSFCFSEEDKKENTSASVSYSREREIGAEIEGERREGKRNAEKRNETLWERECVCVVWEREGEETKVKGFASPRVKEEGVSVFVRLAFLSFLLLLYPPRVFFHPISLSHLFFSFIFFQSIRHCSLLS